MEIVDEFSAVRQETSWEIQPKRSAVLVVDMLNDFLTPGGKMVLPGGEALYGPQKAVIAAARGAGMPIIFINDAHRPGHVGCDREFKKRGEHCIEGTWGAQVVDELAPQPADLQITKRRFSGFFNTDLDLTLKDLGVDTLVVMGVVTNICVRSTIHDAFFHGYQVIVPHDCVAATSQREQDSSLYDIDTHFGSVTDSDKVVAAIKKQQSQ